MASFNKVILLGNLTRDPEMRYTPSGTPVASFGLAVSRRYRQGEESKEEVCFVDITAFGRQAEIAAEYLSKGRPVLIDGRLRWHSWETEGGQKRSKLDVVVDVLQLMPRARDDSPERARDDSPERARDDIPERPSMASSRGRDEFDIPPPEDDDIPF
jgi:single-strand DNA-binding protein